MKDIGVVGLGVMGSNLALNLADKGYTVHVFNRTKSKMQDLVGLSARIRGHETMSAMVGAISRPRRIILMVSAGAVVDRFLDDLDALLEEADTVVDGGNSYFKDTIRRYAGHRYNIVGCGISGGEYGARHGPSMMVGCKKEVYERMRGVFEDISCRHEGVPCCGWLGDHGAGHFVKIVHNGIEYCEMQLLQEVFNMVADGTEQKIRLAREMFEEWSRSELSGYLVEICVKILAKRDGGGFVINAIEDKAEQKGTGKMCVVSSIEGGADTTAMVEAVMARFLSSNKQKRVAFSRCTRDGERSSGGALDTADIKKAFILCKVVGYVQGFNLLASARAAYGWEYTLDQICDIWKDGCILRCGLLGPIGEMARAETPEISPGFVEVYDENIRSLRKVCGYLVENDVYGPVFSSCLMWLNGLKMGEGNGHLIQAMRDYFGRHGVVLKGDGGSVNIDWDDQTGC